MIASDLFYYDETSPSCLRWKVAVSSGRGYRIMVRPGDVAGSIGTRYWHVQVDGVKYKCHRVIWELHGNASVKRLDHENGDALDNRIGNLREITQKANSENRRKSSANSSGVTGVFIGDSYVAAIWKVNRKSASKRFSIAKYGIMQAFKLAADCRSSAITKLNAQGANYTERHGK